MTTLHVSLRVRPSMRETFLAGVTAQARATAAAEPGCLAFLVVEDDAEPNHFLFWETYRDREALQAHRATPHYALWREVADRTVVPGSQSVMTGTPIHPS